MTTTTIARFASNFEPLLTQFADSLLKQISLDYDLDVNDLQQRYLSKTEWVPEKPVEIVVNLGKEPLPKTDKKKKKTAPEDRQKCSGVTAKGDPCKNFAQQDGPLCHIHKKKEEASASSSKPVKEPKEPKEPKKGRKVKAQKKKKSDHPPEHSHELTEEPESPCDLCESHGNVLNPKLPENQFEAIEEGEEGDLQSRLRAILDQTDGDDDDEDSGTETETDDEVYDDEENSEGEEEEEDK